MLSGRSIEQAVARHQHYRDLEREIDHRRLLSSVPRPDLAVRRWWASRGPRVVIHPFNRSQLNPNSYNLRLSRELKVYESHSVPGAALPMNGALDMAKDNPTMDVWIPPEGLVLQPGRLYLGCTMEHTESWNCVPGIEGRSSVARLGMCTHITAGFGDCGFCGRWTLEITVVHPLRVYPGVEICQIYYDHVDRDHDTYHGKYQHDSSATGSLLSRELSTHTHVGEERMEKTR